MRSRYEHLFVRFSLYNRQGLLIGIGGHRSMRRYPYTLCAALSAVVVPFLHVVHGYAVAFLILFEYAVPCHNDTQGQIRTFGDWQFASTYLPIGFIVIACRTMISAPLFSTPHLWMFPQQLCHHFVTPRRSLKVTITGIEPGFAEASERPSACLCNPDTIWSSVNAGKDLHLTWL